MKTNEIIARAICHGCGVDPDGTERGSWDGGPITKGIPAWMTWEGDAETVIDGIAAAGLVIVPRDPTEGMNRAGRANNDYGGEENVWDAMITAWGQEDE